MQLRGKQKRFLRAQANHLQPLFSVGKDGLTDNWLAQLDGALDRRGLIKVSILQNSDVTTDEVLGCSVTIKHANNVKSIYR